jgi:hypothetical protein
MDAAVSDGSDNAFFCGIAFDCNSPVNSRCETQQQMSAQQNKNYFFRSATHGYGDRQARKLAGMVS